MSNLVYVKRKSDDHEHAPVGYIIRFNKETKTATVRWGISDQRTYEEDILSSDLELVTYPIKSPDEVALRQAQEAGGRIHQEGETNA